MSDPAHDLAHTAIDWQRPWLAPYRALGADVLGGADWLSGLNLRASGAGLRSGGGLPLRFVPQSELPAGTSYEAFIHDSGCVPTRRNLHDFFNGLVWLTYPRTKAALNRLQAAQIARMGITQARGPARDAATLFDENAALLVTRDPGLPAALREHDWQSALAARREDFAADADVQLFGHALLEKLVTPYKAITAHTWLIVAEPSYFSLNAADRLAWSDRHMAAALEAREPDTGDFTPLPVLGVPGWWPGQDPGFYQDREVFRPKRR